MKNMLLRMVASLFVVAGALTAATPSTKAFINVSVLPMDSEQTLANQTVIVKGDRIAELGPATNVQVPADAQRIDGAGKFLLPGLGEMHGHNPAVGSPPELFEQVF